MGRNLPVFCLWALVSAASAAQPDTAPIPHVDLPRYMGRWNVIAHTPNLFERQNVGTSDNYTLRSDGGIDVLYAYHVKSLDAPEKQWMARGKVLNAPANSAWTVHFFWLIDASYRVVALDPDYRWVAASTATGGFLWIMARTTALDEGTYRRIVQRMRAKGFDTAKLEKVLQPAP